MTYGDLLLFFDLLLVLGPVFFAVNFLKSRQIETGFEH